jgi:hypothetical protein
MLAQGIVVAPPANAGGSTQKAAAIISSSPGTALGAPTSGERGALAMSPSGGNTPGIGGSGGGTGNASGPDSGSARAGTGPGSAKVGTGPGSSPTAKIGTSNVTGPGGAGTGGRPGVPNTPGVSVQGGSNTIITLPSFGSTPNDPTAAGRSTDTSSHRGPGVTVVATPRSGGALSLYGALKGDRVYTTYIDTTLGTVVLQFADPTSDTGAYSEELNAPEPIRKTLPPSTSHTRVVISCIIDREGNLRNLKAVDGRSSMLTVKLLPALQTWRFRPVLRGDKPIEVTAILGFNIDTR